MSAEQPRDLFVMGHALAGHRLGLCPRCADDLAVGLWYAAVAPITWQCQGTGRHVLATRWAGRWRLRAVLPCDVLAVVPWVH
jgi:hypothetical protein